MFREISRALKGLPRRSWIGFVLAFGLIFLIFLWHLGNLTPGLSRTELDYSNSSKTWSSITANPINAPYKLIQFSIFKLEPSHPSLLRLASIGFALLFCLAFYKLAKTWFGRSIGLFATLIFASTPLLVIGARQAFPAVLFFAPILFIALYSWFLKTKSMPAAAWLLACLAAAVFCFTPGTIIWLVGAVFICRKNLAKPIHALPAWALGVGSLMVAAALGGLAWAAVEHHKLVSSLFLLPLHLPDWLETLKRLVWMASSLFIRTGHGDPLIVGRLPILSILSTALVVFGVYAMLGASRTKALMLGLGVLYAVVLAGLNDNIELLALALPSIAIFMAAGLRYLYIEWRSVFPRNPVPRTFALVLIAFVAAIQVYFGLRYSLAAWPDTPATRASYVLK